MSTILRINYLRQNNLPDVNSIQKIIVSEDKVLHIRCCNTGGQINNREFNFADSVELLGSGQSPNGYSDLVYRYNIEGDNITLWIACVVPDDTQIPRPAEQDYTIETFPNTVFLAEGITDGIEPTTDTVSWVTDLSSLTYAEKQAIAVEEIEQMLLKKEADIENSSKFLDLNSVLPEHVGYWWRSAVSVVKRFFQDPDTDPLIVAEMAKQASAGPTTRNDQLTLLRNLNSLIARYPNGPTFGAIWVETRDLASPSDVTRKTMMEVLQTIGTEQDETYPLDSDFDSTDESWIIANQPGVVTYDNDSPALGETIQATITDYDGGVTNRRYRWQEQTQDGTWSNMSGANNRSWTIASAGTYRCRVLYTDNYATGQEAIGDEFTIT